MNRITPIHRTVLNSRKRQQTFFAKKQDKPLTSEPNRGMLNSNDEKEVKNVEKFKTKS